MAQQMQGQLKQVDFPDNVGGLNLADSVFKIKDNQAAGGVNFDYILTGGIRKRLGSPKVNSSANSALYSLGFGQYAPTSGTSKSIFRAADRKFQLFDTSTPSFTALTEDTLAAGSSPFAASSTQQVQFKQFSTGTSDILWVAGGGATLPVGAYSTTKFTTNGAAIPVGSISVTPTGSDGAFVSVGYYRYGIALHKASTGAVSNVTLDKEAHVTATTQHVTIDLSTITGTDTTKYDFFYIYRSAVNAASQGNTAFTTGDFVAQVASTATTYNDLGSYTTTSINIPRSASTLSDNSVLPSGTYNTLTLWGNRLATSSGNSLYISDVNKSESWPLVNYITVPSAGPITALGVISFTSAQANSLAELLVIFKERELWVLSPGSESDYTTWTLIKIDNTGCPQQSLIVAAQGYLAWVDGRGVHLWDGTSKPIYCSRLIEPLFGTNGDLDKSQFSLGCGTFFSRENQILWFLSSKTYGIQKFIIKLDIRLTLASVEQNLSGRTIEAVLMQDVKAFPVYAALAYIPLNGQSEQLVLGDASGFCYFASNSSSDGGTAYQFRYLTPPLHCGNPNTKKLFHSVVAWVQDIGNWNLYLDYWSEYQTSTDMQSTIAVPVSTENQNSALWDIATWDFSYWDAYYPNVVPVVFNLQPGSANSAQGSAVQLQFRNDNVDEPITIHGFSVVYSELGGITA